MEPRPNPQNFIATASAADSAWVDHLCRLSLTSPRFVAGGVRSEEGTLKVFIR